MQAQPLICSTTRNCNSRNCFALTGGHGLYRDKPWGQILFDIKTLRIAGGSIEILRNYVAQQILKDERLKGLK